jgi:hypothetical protein
VTPNTAALTHFSMGLSAPTANPCAGNNRYSAWNKNQEKDKPTIYKTPRMNSPWIKCCNNAIKGVCLVVVFEQLVDCCLSCGDQENLIR